ncbi:copper homeostasis protein CutC [Neptunicella sp. SCSIO 80796]|uniref:copper homeostasis protein CutC n=1 Tax=Neptunicella plasticusilytica TaxID=3117012 RepID=UPI003A4DF4E6
MTPALEICLAADDLVQLGKNTQAVLEGGAVRIELCANMAEQGLTPTFEAVQLVKNMIGDSVELMVMLRPIAGHFCYSFAQIDSMLVTMERLAKAGADGVVTGVLNEEHQPDYVTLDLLLEHAKMLGLSVTFHRAFDAIDNQYQALERFIQLGINRVLTSGTDWLSTQGVEYGIHRLQDFLNIVDNHMEIIVGGGVSLANIDSLKQQLAGNNRRISFHTYSAVLEGNQVNRLKVANMVSCLTQIT